MTAESATLPRARRRRRRRRPPNQVERLAIFIVAIAQFALALNVISLAQGLWWFSPITILVSAYDVWLVWRWWPIVRNYIEHGYKDDDS